MSDQLNKKRSLDDVPVFDPANRNTPVLDDDHLDEEEYEEMDDDDDDI